MCRNIKTLFNFDPPATDEEIRASALQFQRHRQSTVPASNRLSNRLVGMYADTVDPPLGEQPARAVEKDQPDRRRWRSDPRAVGARARLSPGPRRSGADPGAVTRGCTGATDRPRRDG